MFKKWTQAELEILVEQFFKNFIILKIMGFSESFKNYFHQISGYTTLNS